VEQLFGLKYLLSAVVYSALGIVILLISFVIFDKITPGDMWKEVVEEKNLPLAITLAAMTMAVAQIIASAIHG
jgi:putative membrane protein